MRYSVLVDGKPGAYGVVFPDLPGCVAMGATIDQALTEAVSVARDWMRLTEARGGRVPEPRPAESLRADPEVAEALKEDSLLASVVVVRDSGRPVKANLSLDANILASIDATAARLKQTRSAVVEKLARVGLPLLG